jgi:hypothetical protein
MLAGRLFGYPKKVIVTPAIYPSVDAGRPSVDAGLPAIWLP